MAGSIKFTYYHKSKLIMKTKILFLSVVIVVFAVSCKPKTTPQVTQPEIAVQPPDFKKMITAKVYIKPGREADFIEAAKTIIEKSNSEEGCTFYQLYQDPYKKTNFMFVESYKNQAAVDFHFATPYFTEFGTKIADMISQPAEIKVIDVAGEK
jgi:quinol monooxygenase YgiN